MRLITALLLVLALCTLSVGASVIPAELTEQKCGNGIREGYELCEPDSAYDLCPSIGKVLKIAMVCDERNCACLPNIKDCGNGIPEGSEMCETDEKGFDFNMCGNISNIIGLPLKCDLESCDCVAEGLAVKVSYCGDDVLEGYEDCEVDQHCPTGRVCQNCSCVRPGEDLTNLTPVIYNVSDYDIPTEDVSEGVTTVEDIIRRRKQTVLNFVLEDYVGEVLPEDLDYFDEEEINIYVTNTTINVSVVTTQMVVQEVHSYALNKSSMEIWIDEETVAKIKAADERTALIVRLLEDGTIKYKPRGFFRRFWFLFFRPF